MDISGFMSWFLGQIVRLYSFLLDLLGRITFYGTSLLELIVNLLVLGVVLDIIVISVRSRAVRDISKGSNNSSKGENDED